MCLIIFAYEVHPDYPLVLVANRDEFYARPTAASGWWEDHPEVLAGRDLQAGGTWMGVTQQGRWAALTNVREPGRDGRQAPSRGQLVADFLTGSASPAHYMQRLHREALPYNGYNLLVGQPDALWYYTNRGEAPQIVAPGVYGLSNAALNTPWPKVERGRADLAAWIKARSADTEGLFDLMRRAEVAPDQALPSTGVPLEWERQLSPPFIAIPQLAYGTRVTTVLRFARDGRVDWEERAYVPAAAPRQFEFACSASALQA